MTGPRNDDNNDRYANEPDCLPFPEEHNGLYINSDNEHVFFHYNAHG
jgi:hypothetical protein